MNISIIVATYGEDCWRDLALSRAWPSADNQGAHEVLCMHQRDGTVASVRNDLGRMATGTHLLYCDADDQLGPGFIQAMTRAHEQAGGTDGVPRLFTPRVSYVNKGRPQAPKFWPEVAMSQGNWLVIGTLVPRDLFLEVGGFPEAIHGYEDWACFAACWKAGAQIVKVPDAVYIAHVSGGSRNRRMPLDERIHWHFTIGRSLFPEEYPDDWPARHLRNARRTTAGGRRR